MPSPQWPPSWYVQRAPTAASESGTSQYTPGSRPLITRCRWHLDYQLNFPLRQGKWGKMGENGGKWGKMGEMGDNWWRKVETVFP